MGSGWPPLSQTLDSFKKKPTSLTTSHLAVRAKTAVPAALDHRPRAQSVL